MKNKWFYSFHNDNSYIWPHLNVTKILILSNFAMSLKSIIFVCKCLVQYDLLRVTETSSCKRAWQQKSAEWPVSIVNRTSLISVWREMVAPPGQFIALQAFNTLKKAISWYVVMFVKMFLQLHKYCRGAQFLTYLDVTYLDVIMLNGCLVIHSCHLDTTLYLQWVCPPGRSLGGHCSVLLYSTLPL